VDSYRREKGQIVIPKQARYILHYPVLTVTCYLLYYHFNFPAICNYAAALAVELMVTFALYEAVKRIPIMRYFILEVKAKKH